MKIDRLIGIVTILLQNDKMTAPGLARRFEVSRRTISRDIETLCKAGIPIVTTQGYGGGISIADGYKIDRTLLTKEDLQAVFAGLSGMDSVSRDPTLARLLAKLSDKGQPAVPEDMIIIDLASHHQALLTQKIEQIKGAMEARRLLSFRYCYGKGEGIRRIEPYRLIFKWSSWYVFGFCTDRQDFRLFKLDRLWDLTILEEAFTERELPKEGPALGGHLTKGRFHLRAVFEKSEKYRLVEEYGIDSFSIREDERLVLERDFANYGHMREWIFSFGDRVYVEAPKKLRDDIRQQAKDILEMYAAGAEAQG